MESIYFNWESSGQISWGVYRESVEIIQFNVGLTENRQKYCGYYIIYVNNDSLCARLRVTIQMPSKMSRILPNLPEKILDPHIFPGKFSDPHIFNETFSDPHFLVIQFHNPIIIPVQCSYPHKFTAENFKPPWQLIRVGTRCKKWPTP